MFAVGPPLIDRVYTVAALGLGPVIVTLALVQPVPVVTKVGVTAVTSGRA